MSKVQLRQLYHDKIRPSIKKVASKIRGIQYRLDMRLETLLNAGLTSADALKILNKAKADDGWDSAAETVTYKNKQQFERMLAYMVSYLPQRDRANGVPPSPHDYISYSAPTSAKPPKGESTVYMSSSESMGASGYKYNVKVRIPQFGLTQADQLRLGETISTQLLGATGYFSPDAAREYLISAWVDGKPTSRPRRARVQFNESAMFSKGKIQNAYMSPMRDEKGRFTSEFSLLKRLLLGTSLHDVVQRNMGINGRLVYRTGRLARSAKVDSVSKKNNTINVKYSYMRFPYDVFENPGSSLYNDGARRPTKLIETSIRQLARKITTDRFDLIITRS